MKSFSDILSQYIHSRNISISALSTETGIDRTLIHKFISGKRTPSDISLVCRISDGLMLSYDEKAVLCDSYRYTHMGKDSYERCRKIKKITDYLSDISHPEIFCSYTPTDPLIPMICKDKLSVSTTIRNIISDSSTDHLSVISPPPGTVTDNELISACISNRRLEVTQILTMSSTSADINIDILESILPLLVFSDRYTPLISYCSFSERTFSASLFPNLLLTGKHAFVFNNSCDKGILHTGTDIVGLYNLMFSDISAKSHSLTERRISASPVCDDSLIKINENLYIDAKDHRLSLIYRTGSLWYSIIIYEQILRTAIAESIPFIMSEKIFETL
jgi:hypothetical protein